MPQCGVVCCGVAGVAPAPSWPVMTAGHAPTPHTDTGTTLAQVSYTYHASETFAPELSCPTCTLDDTLTVLNRWAAARAGSQAGQGRRAPCALRRTDPAHLRTRRWTF